MEFICVLSDLATGGQLYVQVSIHPSMTENPITQKTTGGGSSWATYDLTGHTVL